VIYPLGGTYRDHLEIGLAYASEKGRTRGDQFVTSAVADQQMNWWRTDAKTAAPVSQSFTVEAAYTITPIPNEMVTVADIGTFALEVRSTTGFNGSITLSCSGGPAGTSCMDFPAIVRLFDGYGLAISGIQVPKSTPQGTYTITSKGVSGGITNTATATLTVKPR
jgi:hypothetical protein